MTNHDCGYSTVVRRSAIMALAFLTAATAARAQGAMPDAPTSRSIDVEWGRYQDQRQGPEQVERSSRTIKAAANAWLDLANISGEIDVAAVSGTDIVIDMVKRVRARDAGAQELMSALSVDIVERPGRVEVRTVYPRGERRGSAWVDYTVRVPADTSVNLKSISGNIRVTAVKGELRLESVSGDVSANGVSHLASIKSVSGDVRLTDVSSNGDLMAGSVSGDFVARGVDVRAIDVNTVSGDLILDRVRCERAQVRSVSGDVQYSGALSKRGRYEFNAHSGDVRLSFPTESAFEFEASTFSGSVNTALPTQLIGANDRERRGPSERSIRGTIGEGGAFVIVRTFSGDVSIARQ